MILGAAKKSALDYLSLEQYIDQGVMLKKSRSLIRVFHLTPYQVLAIISRMLLTV